VTETGSRKAYEAVAEKLRARITSGEFPTGSQLPAGRELAEEYGVAPNTMLSAIRVLRLEGLVVSQQGRGTFVRDADSAGKTHSPSPEYLWMAAQLTEIQDALRTVSERVTQLEAFMIESSTDEG